MTIKPKQTNTIKYSILKTVIFLNNEIKLKQKK